MVLEQKFQVSPEINDEVKHEVKDEIRARSEIVLEIPPTSEKIESEEVVKNEEKPRAVRKRSIKVKSEQKLEQIPVIREQSQFQNPFSSIVLEKSKKEKQKSEFVEGIIKFIERNSWKILEEKEFKAKEYFSIVQVDTELGPIAFLSLAKDKKSVSDSDLNTLLRQAQSIPLPALFIYTGNLSKKALEYQQKYYSILKTKKAKLS